MTLAFYDVPAGAIGMAREHANSTRYSISRFYFLAVGIHQSLRVTLPGPLGPHRRRVDTGTHSVPGAIGHPTHDFKVDPSLEAAVV